MEGTVFDGIGFIKADMPFEEDFNKNKSPCVIFRKEFMLDKTDKAKIYVCGLGYGYYYINGQKITDDLFTAPVSDYNKTLWYNAYDVSEFLRVGENIIAAICGNGFYNETFNTPWGHNKAEWRDNPKLILKLTIGGETVLVSDDSWKFTPDTPVTFNQLRSGEHFDSRLYDPDIYKLNFNDAGWDFAIPDGNPPKGVFRECLCEPIRECAEYKTLNIVKTGPKKYVFDVGQNISGYIRLNVKPENGATGCEFVIRHAEMLNADYSLQLNEMDGEYFYPQSEFMTDKFICNGGEFIWSPMFIYHGFRYVEIDGINAPGFDTVTGIFVHQDIKTLSEFDCSCEILNKLFKIGGNAVYSNLFYMPTDCPTREKMGWANDAQASAEQMLTNFDTARFFTKWHRDILDSIRADGAVPGIIPTSGWGYEWGNGPVSEGVLFEIPYRIYWHTGNEKPLVQSLPYFERYFDFYESRKEPGGLTDYGLDDWAPPEPSEVPVQFINQAFIIKCLKIAELAARLAKNEGLRDKYERETQKARELFAKNFMNAGGTCKINEQTAVAMAIVHDFYDDISPLKDQLRRLVESRDFHHNCGMAGLPYLYQALNICGLAGYAYKIITAEGYPSYTRWLECGATTLWETWQPGNSKNHHMYSDFMSWMMKTLVGINITKAGYEEVEIKPEFMPGLDFCKGHIDSPKGRISAEWKRSGDNVTLKVTITGDVKAIYGGNVLKQGENILRVF
jgi:alpha-L-rhamnosidase